MAWNGTCRSDTSQNGTAAIGAVAAGATTNVSVSFPVPFPAGTVPTVDVNPPSTRLNAIALSVTNTGFTFQATNWTAGGSSAGTGTYTATL